MLERLRPYLRATSWPIIVAMVVLMVMSLLAVRAAEIADAGLRGCTARQAAYVLVALVGFVAATLVPFQRVGRYAYLLFALNLGLLVLVLRLPEVRFTHRWINLGIVRFQPSELAKLTYILAVAWYLRYRENYRRILGLIPPFVLTLIPAALILIEPDLGTTLLLFPTLFFMLFMAGAKIKHLLAIVGVAAALVFLPVPYCLDGAHPEEDASRKDLAYWHGRIGGGHWALVAAPLARLPVIDKTLMKPHQTRRIKGWLIQWKPRSRFTAEDNKALMDEGFQLQQSMMALGGGGVRGYKRAEAVNLYIRWLPDDHTDFIFAVIGGQWGFLGCAGVIVVYVGIFVCGAEIAAITQDAFGRLLVVGVLALLLTQIFINVGMTVGLMPITGMTLPLISFGGSSMLVNAVALGLLVNVGQRRPRVLSRRPFEYGARTPEQQAEYRRPMEPLDGK